MSGVPCRSDLPGAIHSACATTALRLGDCSEETSKCRTGAVPIRGEYDSAHARTNSPVGVFVYVPQPGVYASTGVSVYVNTYANPHRPSPARPSRQKAVRPAGRSSGASQLSPRTPERGKSSLLLTYRGSLAHVNGLGAENRYRKHRAPA